LLLLRLYLCSPDLRNVTAEQGHAVCNQEKVTIHTSCKNFSNRCTVNPCGKQNRCGFGRIQWRAVLHTLFSFGPVLPTSIRFDAAFIKKHQRGLLHRGLPFTPGGAFDFDVYSVSFGGMYHLFLYRSPSLLRRIRIFSANASIAANLSDVTSDCLPLFFASFEAINKLPKYRPVLFDGWIPPSCRHHDLL
jgi:hypothetical protein